MYFVWLSMLQMCECISVRFPHPCTTVNFSESQTPSLTPALLNTLNEVLVSDSVNLLQRWALSWNISVSVSASTSCTEESKDLNRHRFIFELISRIVLASMIDIYNKQFYQDNINLLLLSLSQLESSIFAFVCATHGSSKTEVFHLSTSMASSIEQ